MFEVVLPKDQQEWDFFITEFEKNKNENCKYTFFQNYHWLNFQTRLKRTAFPLIFLENGIVSGFALGVLINARRGKYIYFRNGPVLDWGNESLVNFVFDFLLDLGRKNNCWFIRFSPLILRNTTVAKIYEEKFQKISPMSDVEALDTWLFEYSSLEGRKIIDILKKKTRYEVNRAIKLNLTAKIENSLEGFKRFYKVFEETFERNSWKAYSKTYIREEFLTFLSSQNANLINVYRGEEVLASGIFLHDKHQIYYHYGASSNMAKDTGAAYLLIYEALKLGNSLELDFFNYFGISPETTKKHPWDGLTLFKQKFPGFAFRSVKARDLKISNLYYLTNFIDKFDKHKKGY